LSKTDAVVGNGELTP